MASDRMIRDGVVIRSVERGVLAVHRLQVPQAIATGNYEQLTDEELNDHRADIQAELERRRIAALPEPGADG